MRMMGRMEGVTPLQRTRARRISDLAYCNPFLPERIEAERALLGDAFVERAVPWNVAVSADRDDPNVRAAAAQADALAQALRESRQSARRTWEAEDQALYADVVFYALYHRYFQKLGPAEVSRYGTDGACRRVEFWPSFARDYVWHLGDADGASMWTGKAAHLFACFFQVRRAFINIYNSIKGTSVPVARLRAAIWQSIFTHDMRRYRVALFDRMGDLTTLILGPTGTGKELVARAIGLSRYIPFDEARGGFPVPAGGAFFPLNLSALSQTLIESELFGHKRGAFTGAQGDRPGWLEVCPPMGSVFLDEVGEVAPSIQVKLLRVLQSREFQRLGESATRRFEGKIIAATHRDLASMIESRDLRSDFYYRLCSDIIRTPSLAEQLAAAPADLSVLVGFIARRLTGEEQTAENLAREVVAWIEVRLGRMYSWPGNFRELEQCVRSILIRGAYEPLAPAALPSWPSLFAEGRLTAEELLSLYVGQVYGRTRNLEETARRLDLDRRTVKARLARAGVRGKL